MAVKIPSAFQPYVVSIEGLSYSIDSDEYGLPDMRWWGVGSVTLKGRIKVRVQYATKAGELISLDDYIIELGQTRTFSNPSGQDMVVFLLETVSAPVYTCPHCGMTFSTQTDLDVHIVAEHPTVPPPPPPPPGKFTWNGCKMIYGGGVNPNIDQILEAGFNTCGPMMGFTGEWLDECLEKGLWVAGGLHGFFPNHNIDGAVAFVNQWKHHPAIGAWFFLDEPTMHPSYTKELQQSWYNRLKAADPSRDFLTNFTSNVQNYYNPNAFDRCSVDVYPFNDVCFKYGPGEWNGNYEGYIKYCIDRWNTDTNHKGGMALVQAFWHLPEFLNPTGHIDDMLAKFQELGVGTQKDGYAMYIWSEIPGGYGVVQNTALFNHVKAVNASYVWPHAPPEKPAVTYTCPHCGATFGSQAELDAHITSEHPAETFTTEDITCSQCGSALRVTISSISANNVSQNCDVCGLSGIAEGTKIEIIHAEPWPPPIFTCPECGATFATQEELDAHIAAVHPVPTYACPECGATFATQEELDAHIASEHPAPVYECPHCGLTFATQVELEAHVASEHPAAPVFTCPYCGAIFASQEDLNAHIATEHPIAAEVVPWWKSWKTYLALGGLGTLIAGIVIKKRLAKRRKSNTMV